MSITKKTGAMSATVSDKSLSETENALLQIVFSDAENYKILKELADPIVNAMKLNAPENMGRVKRSIRTFRSKKRPYSQMQIGPQYIKGGGPDAGNAAHLTEFGTDERVMKKGLRAGGITQGTMEPFAGPPQFAPYAGKKLGRVQAKEWILLTYNQTKSSTENTAENIINEQITKKTHAAGLTIK